MTILLFEIDIYSTDQKKPNREREREWEWNGYRTGTERKRNRYRTGTGMYAERKQNVFFQVFPVRFLLIGTVCTCTV